MDYQPSWSGGRGGGGGGGGGGGSGAYGARQRLGGTGGRGGARAGGRGGGPSGRVPMASRGRGGGNVVFGRTSDPTAKPGSNPMPREKPKQRLSEQRFDKHRSSNPFATNTKRHKTGFSAAFTAGGLPARINHDSGVRQSLTWSLPLEQLNYDPLLLTFFEGLCETDHPYVFVARKGIEDLLAAPGATQKTTPLVGQVVPLIRKALLSKAPGVFDATLVAIAQLSPVVGPALNSHLAHLLVQVSKYVLTGPAKTRELVQEVLTAMEENGGEEAHKAIKKKVPTWQGAFC
jgi:hypothetical protein